MTFEELSNDKLKNNDYLWRYLDFHKFIYLFIEKKLFFTRLDLFQDPFEGVTTIYIKQRYFAKTLPEKEEINTLLPSNIQEEIINKKKSVGKLDEEALIKQKTQYVNCWFYENRESMAMWNIYSNSDSVAIKIEGRQFIDYLQSIITLQPQLLNTYNFICGSVKYYELNPVNLSKTISRVKYSAFKKDTAFDFEKEYRFLITTDTYNKNNNPSFLTIDLTKPFFEMLKVICHPGIQDWKFQNIQKLCKEFGIDNVSKSSIELR